MEEEPYKMDDIKKLILIIGPNGVGKTTTAEILLQKLSKSAYVDADWCRAINPFSFTNATKYAVVKNIYSLFKNYFLCEDIKYVIFPYGFHGERKQIFEQVISSLREDAIPFEVCPIILKCCRDENIRRAIRCLNLKSEFIFYAGYYALSDNLIHASLLSLLRLSNGMRFFDFCILPTR